MRWLGRDPIIDLGPGSHVKKIERCIQTIKGHVRCFENSLPYVMNNEFNDTHLFRTAC